ncbi:hypothetical protein, partial [Pseudaquabacterium pictum]|uniref:hypothetical protein n=1 Tax=Pseudaquabacterium pictum TaxID=2315236 RepID=UPI00357164CB
MLSPLPALPMPNTLPLPEAAAPARDTQPGGADFAALMQQQADRQAALREVDQQVAASARPAEPPRPAASGSAPRPASDNPARSAEPAPGRSAQPAEGPHASDAARPGKDSAPAQQDGAGAARSAGAGAAPPARPAAASGQAAEAGGSAEDPAAADAAAQSVADTAHQAAASTANSASAASTASTAQWARHRLASRLAGTPLPELGQLPTVTRSAEAEADADRPVLAASNDPTANPAATALQASALLPGLPLPVAPTSQPVPASAPDGSVTAASAAAAAAPGLDLPTTLPAG